MSNGETRKDWRTKAGIRIEASHPEEQIAGFQLIAVRPAGLKRALVDAFVQRAKAG